MQKRSVLSIILFLLFTSLLFAGNFQRAVIISDSQNNGVYERVSEKVVAQHPQVVFHCGDCVNNGNNEDLWRQFFTITKKITDVAPFYPACGNHEKGAANLLKHFPYLGKTSWYSTNQVGLHWIVLNTMQSMETDSKQYKWLVKDLKHNRSMFSIIVMHYPVYSSSLHAFDLNSYTLKQLIEKYNIKLVFSGHDHVYERSFDKGTDYIVCGGAGGGLREKMHKNPYSQIFNSTHHYCVLDNYSDSLQVNVYDLQDVKIDTFSILKKE